MQNRRARILVAAHAKKDIKDADDKTAADYANVSELRDMSGLTIAYYDNSLVAAALVKYNIRDLKNSKGRLIIFEACFWRAAEAGDEEATFSLIRFGLSSSIIDIPDEDLESQRRALHRAIIKRHVGVARLLIAAQAALDIKDASGKTAEDYIRSSENSDIRALLPKKLR